MKIFLTGATGFIGSHLAEEIINANYELHCIYRKSLKWLEPIKNKVHLINADLFEVNKYKTSLQSVDIVIHCAGVTKANNPMDYYEVNYGATKVLLQSVAKCNPGLKQFILISSLAAVGPSLENKEVTEDSKAHPVTPYGKSKYLAEKVADKFTTIFPVTTIRPPIVFGPRDTDCLVLFKAVKNNILITTGKKYLSLIFVKDLVRGIVATINQPKTFNKKFFIANDEVVSQDGLLQEIAGVMNKKTNRIYIPSSLFLIFGYFCELFNKLSNKSSIINYYEIKSAVEPYWICSNKLAHETIGFKQMYELYDALKLTYEWYIKMKWL